MSFGCSVLPDSKETELRSSDQDAQKCVTTAISGSVDISEVPECHMICQMSCQCGSQKLIKVLMFHELTACLSVFDLFLTSELLPYYLNDVHEYRFTNV